MKIAFYSVAHISHGGGFERQIIRLTQQLQKLGHEVIIVSASANFTYYLTMLLSFVYFVPRFSFPEMKKTKKEFDKNKKIKVKEFHSFSHLSSLLKTVDVVYAKNEILDIGVLKFAVDKQTPPIICGMHTLLTFTLIDGIHSWIHNKLYTSFVYFYFLKIFDAYHCINTEQVKMLKQHKNKKPMYYIPNFVEASPHTKRKKGKDFTILFVGRLSKQKGIDMFLAVIEQIQQKNISGVSFIICGAGPLEQKVRDIAQKYPHVLYKGSVSAIEMKEIYKQSDVFCLTSCGEAFPVATMEALSFGLPVVGFSMPGLRDIIRQGENGYLVHAGNINEIVKKIVELKRMHTKQYETLSQNAVRTITTSFSLVKLVPQYDMMFKSVKQQYEKN